MQTIALGPQHGTLTMHTGVEGRAAKAGHALTLLISDWSGTATFDSGQPTSLAFTATVNSLAVVSGEGGLKPLSDKDKRTVQSTALETLSAGKHPEATFVSRAVTARGDGYQVDGDLALNGVTAAVAVDVSVSRANGMTTFEAKAPVVQTQFGVKPYTGLMGGLKVRDRVDVIMTVSIPEPG